MPDQKVPTPLAPVLAGTVGIALLLQFVVWPLLNGQSLLPGSTPRPTPSPIAGREWDAGDDFRNAVAPENPMADAYGNAAVWSFMDGPSSYDISTFELLPEFDPGRKVWSRPEAEEPVFGPGFDRGLYLNPWGSGTPDSHPAIVRWTSPFSGKIKVRGHIVAEDRSCELAAGTLSAGLSIIIGRDRWLKKALHSGELEEFGTDIAAEAGSSLFFMVSPYEESRCDAATLWVVITEMKPG